MSDIGINVLVEAKKEYTKQLIHFLVTPIYQGIQSIYNDALNHCEDCGDRNILMKFQQLLREIPKWNQEIIDDEYERIIEETNCNWLGDLIKAVFVANVKVLSSVRLGSNFKKITLKIPEPRDFLHRTYIEVARGVYADPYLFSHQVKEMDVHRNMKDARKLIGDAIEETVRKMLPVQQVLQEYLGEDYQQEGDQDISKSISDADKNNIQAMIQKEVQEMYRTSTPPPTITPSTTPPLQIEGSTTPPLQIEGSTTPPLFVSSTPPLPQPSQLEGGGLVQPQPVVPMPKPEFLNESKDFYSGMPPTEFVENHGDSDDDEVKTITLDKKNFFNDVTDDGYISF